MIETISRDFSHKLAWFEVDYGQIRFKFGAVAVDIYGDAEIIETDGAIYRIDDAFERQGDLQAVWRLLGRSMTGFVMDEDSFRLSFQDGAMIRAKNKKSYDFVKVWGPDFGCETGYPTAIYLPTLDPTVYEGMREMILGRYPRIILSPLPLTPKLLETIMTSQDDRPVYTPPPPRPLIPRVTEGKAGKTITLDKDAEFLKFTVDPEVVTARFSGLKVRFNHSFEVVDVAGRVHASIDAKGRTGDLDALWTLIHTDMARIEMDAQSFRIYFKEGAIIRSFNQTDIRKPDLEQVDFWLAPGDSYDSPLPENPQHYPANIMP